MVVEVVFVVDGCRSSCSSSSCSSNSCGGNCISSRGNCSSSGGGGIRRKSYY